MEGRYWGRKAFPNNEEEQEQWPWHGGNRMQYRKTYHAQEMEGDGDLRLMVGKAQIKEASKKGSGFNSRHNTKPWEGFKQQNE